MNAQSTPVIHKAGSVSMPVEPRSAFEQVFGNPTPKSDPGFKVKNVVEVLSVQYMGLNKVTRARDLIGQQFRVEDVLQSSDAVLLKLSSGFWHNAKEVKLVN